MLVGSLLKSFTRPNSKQSARTGLVKRLIISDVVQKSAKGRARPAKKIMVKYGWYNV